MFRGLSTAHTLQKVLRHIATNQAGQFDFLVCTGDLVNAASPGTYQTFARLLGLRENPSGQASFPNPLLASLDGLPDLPVYCLPGNHDDHDYFYRQLYPQSVGMGLANAAFVHKGVQFIFLDFGPEVKATAHPETIDFLDRSLQKGLPSIILFHHHLYPIGSAWLDAFIADDAGRFWQTVTGRGVLGIFCGHAHISYEIEVAGIPVMGVRSTAFQFLLQDAPLITLQPPHYRKVTVRDGVMTSELFEVKM